MWNNLHLLLKKSQFENGTISGCQLGMSLALKLCPGIFAGWHRLKLCQRPLKQLSNVFQLHSATPVCVQALCNLEFHLEYRVCMQFEVLNRRFLAQ